MRKIGNNLRVRQLGAILIFFLVLCWATALWASPIGSGTVTGQVVNIRSQASTAGKIVTQVAKGDRLAVLDQQNNWYQVETEKGQQGWVADYLVEFKAAAAEPTAAKAATPAQDVRVRVDGQFVEFDAAPYIDAQDRTMVPIRFVANQLGAQVFWNAEEQLVTITQSQKIILLWIGQAKAKVNNEEIALDTTPVIKDGRTMVPLRFIGDSLGLEVGWEGLTNTVVLTTKRPAPEPAPTPATGSNFSRTALITGSVVNMRQGPGTDYEIVTQAKQGELLSIIGEADGWYQVQARNGQQGWLANWLVAVRTDVNAPSRSPDPEERPRPVVPVYTGPNFLTEVTVDDLGDSLEVRVAGKFPLNYSYMTLGDPERVVVDFHNTTLALDWARDELSFAQNKLASGLRVGQFNVNQARVVIDLKDVAGMSINPNEEGTQLVIKLQTPSIQGKVIVIDPGHGKIQPGGWSDPGAIGASGLYERDVTTDISWKLQQILSREGATVIMTRTGDTTPLDLVGRSLIANENGADIFVSVHINSSTNGAVAGTSTYFYAPQNSILQGQRNSRQRLASLVQRELVAKLGRRNIGTLEANFVVLRETTMPSILAEIAFISNSEEEKLLSTEAFRMNAAEGLAKGIIRYFAEQ